MNKNEFMKSLEGLLNGIPKNEKEEAIQFYTDYFEDAGITDEMEVMESLGTPEEVAEAIKSCVGKEPAIEQEQQNDTTQTSGEAQSQPGELIVSWKNYKNMNWDGSNRWKRVDPDVERRMNEGKAGNAAGNFNANNQNTYANNNFNNNAGFNNGNGYGNNAYYNNAYNAQPKKKQLEGWQIALIVIGCIVASPIVIPVAAAGIGTIIALICSFFGIVIGLIAACFGLVVTAIVVFCVGCAVMPASMPLGFMMIGISLIILAIFLLILTLVVWICGWAIPAIVKGITNLCTKERAN